MTAPEGQTPAAFIGPEGGSAAKTFSNSLTPSEISKLTVEDLPYRELERHHIRLGRLCHAHKKRFWQRVEWSAVFGGLAILFAGGAVGGGIALIPFLATDPHTRVRYEYYAVIAGASLVAALCALSRMAIKKATINSIDSEYEEFGEMLKRYEEELAKRQAAAAAAALAEAKP